MLLNGCPFVLQVLRSLILAKLTGIVVSWDSLVLQVTTLIKLCHSK